MPRACATILQPHIETLVTYSWYAVVAGDGLRSNGVDALPPSKSECSILPTARFYGPGSRTLPPARSDSLLLPRPPKRPDVSLQEHLGLLLGETECAVEAPYEPRLSTPVAPFAWRSKRRKRLCRVAARAIITTAATIFCIPDTLLSEAEERGCQTSAPALTAISSVYGEVSPYP